MGQEINHMIERIIPQLQQFWLLILVISILTGLVFIIGGLLRLAGSGGRMGQQSRYASSSALVLCGFVLVNIPAALDTITLSTMAQASMQSLSYAPPESAGRNYIRLAVYIVQLVGICGFIRGWNLMGKIGSRGDGAFWKATTHVIGGCWAVNIIGFLRMIGFSFGGPIGQAVNFTLG
jgi:hypothetical protein